MLFCGVVRAQTEKGRGGLPRARGGPEAMIGEVREDEPALANELWVEAVELAPS